MEGKSLDAGFRLISRRGKMVERQNALLARRKERDREIDTERKQDI